MGELVCSVFGFCTSIKLFNSKGVKKEMKKRIEYNDGPVDKSKKSAGTHSGSSRIINWEIAKDGILPSA